MKIWIALTIAVFALFGWYYYECQQQVNTHKYYITFCVQDGNSTAFGRTILKTEYVLDSVEAIKNTEVLIRNDLKTITTNDSVMTVAWEEIK